LDLPEPRDEVRGSRTTESVSAEVPGSWSDAIPAAGIPAARKSLL